MVCSSLLQAHFDYGFNVWYNGLLKTLKTKAQTAQNKMNRFMVDSGNRSYVSYNHVSKLNWLSVQRQVEYFTLSAMYNVCIGSASKCMLDHFISNQHQYKTRMFQFQFCSILCYE